MSQCEEHFICVLSTRVQGLHLAYTWVTSRNTPLNVHFLMLNLPEFEQYFYLVCTLD